MFNKQNYFSLSGKNVHSRNQLYVGAESIPFDVNV